jgi:hypothetical protein
MARVGKVTPDDWDKVDIQPHGNMIEGNLRPSHQQAASGTFD